MVTEAFAEDTHTNVYRMKRRARKSTPRSGNSTCKGPTAAKRRAPPDTDCRGPCGCTQPGEQGSEAGGGVACDSKFL